MATSSLVNRLNALWAPLEQTPRTAALLLGGLLALGLAPLYIWPVCLPAFGGLYFLLTKAQTAKQAFGIGWFFGLGYFLAGLWWIGNAFTAHAPQEWMVILAAPAVLVLCAYLALYSGLAALATKVCSQKGQVGLLLFALFWTLTEGLRATMIYGFPWNSVGYIFADSLPLMQLAAHTQVWGLTFVAVFCGAAFYRPASVYALKSLIILALLFAYGTMRLDRLPQTFADDAPTVRLVQPNVKQTHKWQTDKRVAQVKTYMHLSNAPANKPLDGIVWAETALPFFLEEQPHVREVLTHRRYPVPLVTGTPRRTNEGGDLKIFNSIISLSAKGPTIDIYNKHLLVPFGEFMPLRAFLSPSLQKLTHGDHDYTRGRGRPLMETGFGTALSLICYEAIFPDFIHQHKDKADFILNMTNDAWFDGTPGPHQHFAMARMRAVETGLPLIRIANTGISGGVDGVGRLLNRSKKEQKVYLDVTLPEPVTR